MKTSHKIAATFFSFGIMIGTACAQEEKPTESSPQSEDASQNTGYGRKMRKNAAYEGYCDRSPCAGHRRGNRNRMSHRDRQRLREQVNEAGKNLYSGQDH